MNRDWAWQTQIESEQRMVLYHDWMPHIHADLHEQYFQNPYYFAPAAEPMHPYINQWQRDFQIEIGKNHAKYFDQNSWLYFTREVFDLFYPSYGDTYPTFNGSIGMTYEQAGHSMAGRAILLPNMDTLTLADRIEHHKTTSLSTVEIASKNMVRIVHNFETYFNTAQNTAKGDYKAYVIKYTNNKDRMKALCQLLDKNKISYGVASSPMAVNAFDYNNLTDVKLKIESQDLVISAAQPMGVLTQVLFDPNTVLSDSLTYDITAWALPSAYGLEAYASTDPIKIKNGYDFSIFKKKEFQIQHPYAYLCKWGAMADAQFLAALQKQNIKVRVASALFTLEGASYPAGTIVITRADNRKRTDFDKKVQSLAKAHQRALISVTSGFSDSGIDLGSEKIKLLNHPKVAVLSGEKTNPSSFGFVWYYFEHDLNYPVDIFRKEVSHIDLNDYNVLVIPEGRFYFSFNEREKIKSWVRKGGTLIALGSANREFADQEGFALQKKKADEKNSKKEEQLSPYDTHQRTTLEDANPGAIFKVRMDTTHPLAYGMAKEY
ncbi:MAG TPA: zinc carboxypeptidase, partial [Saprospiraceae bacterium]|nr:zinc carboxypeptidase [Saprospiraceae bacterium]